MNYIEYGCMNFPCERVSRTSEDELRALTDSPARDLCHSYNSPDLANSRTGHKVSRAIPRLTAESGSDGKRHTMLLKIPTHNASISLHALDGKGGKVTGKPRVATCRKRV